MNTIYSHGWNGDDSTDFILGATPALLDHSDFNILIIDWGEGPSNSKVWLRF